MGKRGSSGIARFLAEVLPSAAATSASSTFTAPQKTKETRLSTSTLSMTVLDNAQAIPLYVSTQRPLEVEVQEGLEGSNDEDNASREVEASVEDVGEEVDQRPTKKRRVDAGPPQVLAHSRDRDAEPSTTGDGLETTLTTIRTTRDDADQSHLVPHYTHMSQVPANLRKYFSQRTRLFSLYASGCLLDEEGWYSVTPERIADRIAERCRCDVVLDAFCGVGGNAIAFARTCERVIALDISPTRLALARHNARIYGVEDRIEFVLADYRDFARAYLASTSSKGRMRKRGIDVVFLSPPWGGPGYISGTVLAADMPTVSDAHPATGQEGEDAHPSYSLSSIQPIHGADLFALTRHITPNVAYFLPRNTDLHEVAGLLQAGPSSDTNNGQEHMMQDKGLNDGVEEHVEVEELWMGSKLKALACYFGGLVQGQEALFDLDSDASGSTLS